MSLLTGRYRLVNASVTPVAHRRTMQAEIPAPDPFAVRLLWVLLGECAFAVGAYLVTGAPPALVVTVGFGVALAVLLAAQAIAPATHPRR